MALPLLFALTSDVDAAPATLRIKARLREGPSKQTTLLGWVDAGTVVEIVEEKAGWRRVQLPDGRGGYVWGQHFAVAEVPVADGVEPSPVVRAEAAPPPPTVPSGSAPSDELRALRAEVEALRNRPEPAATAAVEQLRGEVGRLATAQQEFARRLDARGPDPVSGGSGGGLAPTIEGTAGAATLFLVVGAFLGWILSRLMQRWRDRRSRIRI